MLGIGDLVKVSNEKDLELWTVLGSCVSIIFHIPNQFSLMCHAQLPELSERAQREAVKASVNGERRFIHVNTVLAKMMALVKEAGFLPSNVDVSLMGGCGTSQAALSQFAVGEKNVEAAKKILNQNGYIIRRERTGMKNGVTLWYYPETNLISYRLHNELSFDLINTLREKKEIISLA